MYDSLQNINDKDENFVHLSLHLFLIFKDMPILMVLQNFKGGTYEILENLVSYRNTAYVPCQHVQY